MQERRNSIAYALELRLSCTNPSICGTNTTHEVMMCHTPFPFQSVKGASHTARWKFWPYPPCVSLPIWLIDMWPRNKSLGPFLGQKGDGQSCWVVGSFCDVCSMAIWPIHFIWGTKKNPWRDDASHTTSRSKGQGHILFCAYLTDLLDIRHKHNSWGDDKSHTVSRSKGQVT